MTQLRLYNTRTRKEEDFTPLDLTKKVRMYVCGPTVYDFAHIGNARPAVVFDVLFRLLRRLYGNDQVMYVQNITDIDDKIIVRSQESGEPIEAITKRTAQAYIDDMQALNTLPPTFQPRATEYIPQMQTIIGTLIEKSFAYEAEGHVLFDVSKMTSYGMLSGLPRDKLIEGARVEVAPYKKNAADFVLWKPSTDDQPGWDSPWGRGRPGWHIECSAMSGELLGAEFDIHGGGLDLIFPHHENEVAQSCCANNTPILANFWMHNGFLEVNGAKMSKSLGNFFTVRELLAKYPGEVIRFVLLSAHYTKPLDFTDRALKEAKATLDKWYGALRAAHAPINPNEKLPQAFEDALSNNLNTPLAIVEIHNLINQLNRTHPLPYVDRMNKTPIKSQILAAGAALGLLQQDPEAWFKWQPANQSGPSDAEIEAQIAARTAAKKAKNFAESDRIRDALAAQNIILEDGPTGTKWRRG